MKFIQKTLLIISVFIFISAKSETAYKIIDTSFSFDKYPLVEFKFWSRSFNPIDTTLFKLTENGINKKTTFSIANNNSFKNATKNKILYILIENHYLQKGNNERVFFKNILTASLQGRIIPGDKIYIATFDWFRNGKYSFLLDENASDNEAEIFSIINSIAKPQPLANQQSGADIYFALDDAIKFLSNLNYSLPKNILLLSDDFPNIAGQKTAEEIRDASLKADIPIYAIGYNIGANRYSQLTKEEICENTNGTYFSSINNDANACIEALISIINNMNIKSTGKMYFASFKTNQDKCGQSCNITISVKGKNATVDIKYPFTLWDWMLYNPFLFGLIICALILLIILIPLLIKKYKAKQKQRLLIEEQKEIQLQQTQSEIDKLKQKQANVQQNIIIQSNTLEKENKAERLAKLMQLKNLYPRVLFDNNGQNGELVINTPTFTIGRDIKSNSFAINAPSISRNHVEIYFDENMQFTIKDLNSTNGLIINGNKVNSAVLKDADIIQLGDVLLKINL